MAINYAKIFNRRATPQSQPIPGSTQVRNSGGGYSWEVDDWTRLDRFLILGAEGGTYYITERDLVKQNHDAIVRCVKADGIRAVNRIVEISDSGRAPKNDPAILALALIVTHGDAQAKAPGITRVNLSPGMRLADVIKRIEGISMGGTDCALPMLWAARNKLNVSGFVTYTDSETWAGNIHPAQALRQYRSEFVGDAKAVVVGMTSNASPSPIRTTAV